MRNPLKFLAAHLARHSVLYTLSWSARKGYLHQTGWTKSFRTRTSVDKDARPLPWISYPCIAFLEPRVRSDMVVFEYGCGNSTLWWAQRVARVVSCEHDAAWYEKVKKELPANVELVYAPLDDDTGYVGEAARHPGMFDILVIDGRRRVACARNALSALKPSGIILWDNTERDEYREGLDFLRQNGFRHVDFAGMGPITEYASTTSIFYRDGNCLDL